MPVEDTVLDPPATPAPIFAYRALKGWFVGSPDSSPEQDNKENISPSKARPKSVGGVQPGTIPNLSPQKRKRESDLLVSPSKSILRTPGGAPTPRAKSLRDVNVKFKSLSPDVRRKEPPAAPKDQQRPSEATPTDKPKEAKVLSTSSGSRASQNGANLEPQAITISTKVFAEPDLQDHYLRTEKEMKRLLKYGHKWRECARRMDEENAKLRILLDESQKQNRRLEAALQKRGKTQEGAKTNHKEAEHRRAVATRLEDALVSSAALKTAAQDIEDLLDLTPPPEATNPAVPAAQRSTSATLPTRPSNVPLRSQPRKAISNPLPHRPTSTTTYTAIPKASPITTMQHRIEGSVLPISDPAARTGLPAARIAAARKRLMARNQAKVAGLSVVDEAGRDVGNRRRESFGEAGVGKGTEFREESGVDWVGV